MRKEELIDELRRLSSTERRELLAEFANEVASATAPHIFLSYSRDDTPFVHDLVAGLERGGVRVWFDVRELAIGEDYLSATAKALRECDFCVVVVTAYSMGSVEVARELEIARDVGTVILPVIMQDAALVESVRNLQWIDFRFHFEAPLAALIARLHGRFDGGLTMQRLTAATKPLQAARGFIPLFQKSGPASVRWFNGFLVASAFSFFFEVSFISPKSAVDWRGFAFLLSLFGMFAVMLLCGAFRVANRRETLTALRIALWIFAFTAPFSPVAFATIFEAKLRRSLWGCAILSELALLAAIVVVELSSSFRRQLRARPEKIEIFPRWWPFRKRTSQPSLAS